MWGGGGGGGSGVLVSVIPFQLELMFMKHYAPNRCLYIKVANLRTGLGSADVTPTKLLSQNIYKEHWVGLGGGQDGCEQRIKVFVKIQKKKLGGGGGVLGVRLGGQGECE